MNDQAFTPLKMPHIVSSASIVSETPEQQAPVVQDQPEETETKGPTMTQPPKVVAPKFPGEGGKESSESPSSESAATVRTNKFHADLQSVYSDILKVKISKDLAWELFKHTIEVTIYSVINDGRLPLQNIGVFEIIKAVSRKGKIVTHNFVPKFRFRPSERIDKYLEGIIPGVKRTTAEQEKYKPVWEKKRKELEEAMAKSKAAKETTQSE